MQRAGEGDRVALNELCAAYRGPLLGAALYRTRDPERAEDLVQGFLERFVVKEVASVADRARGSFRAFLGTSLRNYMYNVHAHENILAVGGGVEFTDADGAALTDGITPERLYNQRWNQHWARALLDRVLARLREDETGAGRGARFEALLDRLTGDDDAAPLRRTAELLGKSEGAVRVDLFRLRRLHVAVLRAEVADTVDRPEDVDRELYELLDCWSAGT